MKYLIIIAFALSITACGEVEPNACEQFNDRLVECGIDDTKFTVGECVSYHEEQGRTCEMAFSSFVECIMDADSCDQDICIPQATLWAARCNLDSFN